MKDVFATKSKLSLMKSYLNVSVGFEMISCATLASNMIEKCKESVTMADHFVFL